MCACVRVCVCVMFRFWFSGSTDSGGELERGRGDREMCQQNAATAVHLGLGGETRGGGGASEGGSERGSE